MGDPSPVGRGESGVLGEGEWQGDKPNIKQIVKKKTVKKSQKLVKNQKNQIFFSYWKWSKMH